MGPSSACSGASSCLASGLPEGGLRPGPFPRFLGRGVLLSAASSETSDSRPLSPLLEGSTIGRFLLRTWRRGPSSLQRAGLSIFSGLGSSFRWLQPCQAGLRGARFPRGSFQASTRGQSSGGGESTASFSLPRCAVLCSVLRGHSQRAFQDLAGVCNVFL